MLFPALLLVLVDVTRPTSFKCKQQTNRISLDHGEWRIVGSFSNGSEVDCKSGCLAIISHVTNLKYNYDVNSRCADNIDFELRTDFCAYRPDGYYCVSFDRLGNDHTKAAIEPFVENIWFTYGRIKQCPHYNIVYRNDEPEDYPLLENVPNLTCKDCAVKLTRVFPPFQEQEKHPIPNLKLQISAGCRNLTAPVMHCSIVDGSAQCPCHTINESAFRGKDDGQRFVKMYEETFRPIPCYAFYNTISSVDKTDKEITKFDTKVCNGTCQTVATLHTDGLWHFETGCPIFKAVSTGIVTLLRDKIVHRVWTCNTHFCNAKSDEIHEEAAKAADTHLEWILKKFGILNLTEVHNSS